MNTELKCTNISNIMYPIFQTRDTYIRKNYLRVVPPHVQPIVPEDDPILVDMIDGELDRGHDATADVALGHVMAEREESGDVNVSFPCAAQIYRPLTGTVQHSIDPENEGAEVSGR